MISFPLISYVLLAALRDRLLPALFVTMAVLASLCIFTGSAAVVEGGQFAVVFTAGALRFVSVLGLVLFVVFHIRRSFENKDVEYLLSRPVSRVSFILSHAVAFSLLAVITALIVVGVVMAFMPFGLIDRTMFWGASVAAELIIIVNVALFFSMVLPSATTGVLATLALYTLARMMGEILGIIDHDLVSHLMRGLGWIMQGVSLILPRLDLMGQTSWLVYGKPAITLGFIGAQTVIYTGLALMAAIIDLTRRQF
jgi:hypothetical protein